MRRVIEQSRLAAAIMATIMTVFVALPLVTSAMMQPRTISVAPGGDVQAALNSANCGDTIILQAGAVYPFNGTLPNKPCTGYIPIQSSRAAELPVGVRVSPSQSALLATLQSGTAAEPVVKTAAGAHHFRFIGIKFAQNPNLAIFDIVRFGDGRQVQNQLTQVPHHLSIDRSWITGDSLRDSQRGVAMNCADCELTNSYVSDIHGVGFDTQAVCAWNTPGPIRIVNNYLEGAGENVLIGGADPASEAFIPSNVDILRNTISKPWAWKVGHATFVPITRNGSTLGTNGVPLHWTVKNNIEVKNGKNIRIEGNIVENNWTDGQTGIPILFTVRNQEGTAPYSTIGNVTFANNTVKNAEGGINLLGSDNEKPSQRASSLVIRNNVFDQINGPFLTMNGYDKVAIERNTHFQSKNTMTLSYTVFQGFVYRDNVTIEKAYGVIGDFGLIGKAGLDKWGPGYVFTGNVMAHPPLASADNWYAPMPSGNEFPASIPVDADYRTPYVGKGANIDELKAAQSGGGPQPTPTPTPTPVPSPSPSPTATPLPSPVPSPSPSPSPTPRPVYEVLELNFSGEAALKAKIKECAAQGYDNWMIGSTGKVLYCSRVKQ